MGIDGMNSLEIRGSKEDLDALQQSGLVLKSTKELEEIANRFFGLNQVHVLTRTNTRLFVSYEFRNYPVYEYLYELLKAYPRCWMKNTFHTETGTYGVWVGRFQGGEPEIQEFSWKELSYEEQAHLTDFSK